MTGLKTLGIEGLRKAYSRFSSESKSRLFHRAISQVVLHWTFAVMDLGRAASECGSVCGSL